MSDIEIFKNDWSESKYNRNFELVSHETHIAVETVLDNYYIPCMVCGEEIFIPKNSELKVICPKCKNAIMKMRSMMTEEELNG